MAWGIYHFTLDQTTSDAKRDLHVCTSRFVWAGQRDVTHFTRIILERRNGVLHVTARRVVAEPLGRATSFEECLKRRYGGLHVFTGSLAVGLAPCFA